MPAWRVAPLLDSRPRRRRHPTHQSLGPHPEVGAATRRNPPPALPPPPRRPHGLTASTAPPRPRPPRPRPRPQPRPPRLNDHHDPRPPILLIRTTAVAPMRLGAREAQPDDDGRLRPPRPPLAGRRPSAPNFAAGSRLRPLVHLETPCLGLLVAGVVGAHPRPGSSHGRWAAASLGRLRGRP